MSSCIYCSRLPYSQEENYENRARFRRAPTFWRFAFAGGTRRLRRARQTQSAIDFAQSRFARTDRAARIHRGLERISRAGRGYLVHSSARRLGTHRLAARPAFVSTSHDLATARHSFLGHGRLAHGLEREHGRDERSQPTEPRSSHESATRIFRSRPRFSWKMESATIPSSRNFTKRSPVCIATNTKITPALPNISWPHPRNRAR